MRTVPVNGSQQPAMVDDGDYDRVQKYTWGVLRKKSGAAYAVRNLRIDGRSCKILMHRFILRLEDAAAGVDHKNRNGLDNRRKNLRFAEAYQNSANRPGLKNGTSKYKGVSWDIGRQKWSMQLCVQGKVFRGRFSTEAEAAHAYDKLAAKNLGEWAYLNFRGSRVSTEVKI